MVACGTAAKSCVAWLTAYGVSGTRAPSFLSMSSVSSLHRSTPNSGAACSRANPRVCEAICLQRCLSSARLPVQPIGYAFLLVASPLCSHGRSQDHSSLCLSSTGSGPAIASAMLCIAKAEVASAQPRGQCLPGPLLTSFPVRVPARPRNRSDQRGCPGWKACARRVPAIGLLMPRGDKHENSSGPLKPGG